MLIALREPVFVFTRVGGGRRKAMVGPEGSSFTRVMGSWHSRGEFREKSVPKPHSGIRGIVEVELKLVLKLLWCVL